MSMDALVKSFGVFASNLRDGFFLLMIFSLEKNNFQNWEREGGEREGGGLFGLLLPLLLLRVVIFGWVLVNMMERKHGEYISKII